MKELEKIVLENADALVLYARQWVRCQADAEDVLQNAVMRLLNMEPERRPTDPKALLPLMYQCVKYSALDYVRSETRRHKREDKVAEQSSESYFETGYWQHENREWIEKAMTRLSEDQKEVLVMKIWGGLTFDQIAEQMKCSINTAASRYRYAMNKLREALTPGDTHEPSIAAN